MTEDNKAILRFSDAVSKVWRKRYDFVATVMAGHRELAVKAGIDPYTSQSNLQLGLAMTPGSAEHTAARLEMITALLHVWYRIQPDIKAAVMNAIREIAVFNGEDETAAIIAAGQVVDGARGAGEAQKESLQRVSAVRDERELKLESKAKAKMLARLDREALRDQPVCG